MTDKHRLKLDSPENIRKSLNRICNLILNDDIELKKANAIAYICNITLASIRTDEHQKKLDVMEKRIEEMQEQRIPLRRVR